MEQIDADPYAKYLPQAAREQLCAASYRGYEAFVSLIGECLMGNNGLLVSFENFCQNVADLVVNNVSTEEKTRYESQVYFMKRGGDPSSAVDCIVDVAQSLSGKVEDHIQKKCANDSKFDTVRWKFGLLGSF